MKNPFREWQRREMERADAKGGLHFLWFHLTVGLIWGLFMFVSTSLIEYLRKGAPDAEDVQTRALIWFGCGMFFGLILWVVRSAPGSTYRGRRI